MAESGETIAKNSSRWEACIHDYTAHGPNVLWEVVQDILAGKTHQRVVYETGYAGAVAFANASPYAPVSVLVCPTKKPYLNIEHFAMEEGADAVGKFMQAVCKVARDAVLAFDAAVTGKALIKRDYYERAFAEHEVAKTVDAQALTAFTAEYVRDSVAYSFALRDRHTGHSGYRIAFNNGTGATGMSQPHMHAQIAGGRYLGGLAVKDPYAIYPIEAFGKVAHSLIHRAIKGKN